jgi:hypothetical protein
VKMNVYIGNDQQVKPSFSSSLTKMMAKRTLVCVLQTWLRSCAGRAQGNSVLITEQGRPHATYYDVECDTSGNEETRLRTIGLSKSRQKHGNPEYRQQWYSCLSDR